MEHDKSIVTIHGAHRPAGVGFVIGNQHVITCAHVVNVALDRDQRSQNQPIAHDEIHLEFPLIDGRPERRARVVRWDPPAPSHDRLVHGLSDIAVLRLNEPIPTDAAVMAVTPDAVPGEVQIFGYPSEIDRPRGGWVTCRFQGVVHGGLLQLDALPGGALRPQPGYSGSPVVDEHGRAVGMLAEASIRDNQSDCYAIPTQWLREAWPDLTNGEAPPPEPKSNWLNDLVGRGTTRSILIWRTRRRLVIMISLALVVLTLGTIGGALMLQPASSAPPASVGFTDCGVTLQLSASIDKDELLGKMAEEYNRSRCSNVVVTGKVSGEAAEALGRGWDEAIDGPKPDLWSPSSSIWAAVVESREAPKVNAVSMPKERPSVARTPVVIAMPRPMAEALGWPNTDLGWSALHDLATGKTPWPPNEHPDWGSFTLGKDNPRISTSGLLSAVATFAAAAGVTGDMTPEQVKSQQVLDYVRGVEARAVHYGPTVLHFFEEFLEADRNGRSLSYVSAVAGSEEKVVWDYNQGNPKGLLGPDASRKKPSVPMVALYPSDGTLESDHPLLTLGAPWVDGAKQRMAQDFLGFLLAPERQQRFTEAGFRNAKGERGPNLAGDPNFAQKANLRLINTPGGKTIAAVVDSWAEVRKRARVLVVMDVSGSMQNAATAGGSSKLKLAQDAAKNAIGELAGDDQLGLWAFSAEIGGAPKPWRELVPIGPVNQVRDTFKKQVDGLKAGGGTALYRTTRDAVASVQDRLDDSKINAVVLLSDGMNEDSDKDLDRVLRELAPEDLAKSVRVFTIAYGDTADKGVLQKIATTSQATAYDASDPTTIDKVFTQVLSSF